MIRDALFVVGGASTLTGLWWVWPPLCLIIGGILVAGVGWVLPRRES